MNISHRKLEQIRFNPANIKQILSSFGGRNSMNKSLEFALRKYHQNSNDKDIALKYLISSFNSFASNKRNYQIQEILLNKFHTYIADYSRLGFEFLNESIKISIDIHHGNIISGNIFRIDKVQNDEGIAITLMCKESCQNWKSELRFPLFQIYFSDKFSIPAENVKVGIYNLEDDIHEYRVYNESELQNSIAEIRKLSNSINAFNL